MNIIPLVTIVGGTPQSPQLFLPGTDVRLDAKEAKRLVNSDLAVFSNINNVVSDVKELIESIVDAIAELPKSGFGKDGKPNVKSLQHILECEVTATQRDEAWDKFQQLSQKSSANTSQNSS